MHIPQDGAVAWQGNQGTNNPWQLRRCDLAPYAATRPISSLPSDGGPRSYSEADLHEYAMRRRRMETTPPQVPAFAEGTWSIDSFDGLWQLRRYPIRDLVFPGGDPFAREWGWFSEIHPWLVEKYLAWLCEGHEPPPLAALETERGGIKVTNGHNRAASLVRAGRIEVLAWVSLAYTKPGGYCADLTHALAVELALRQGLPVPPAVLADYPQLAALKSAAA
jgi:hypothetical protein